MPAISSTRCSSVGPCGTVLGHQCVDDGLIFVGILPGQDGVARQHAVAQRIEAGDVGAAGLGR